MRHLITLLLLAPLASPTPATAQDRPAGPIFDLDGRFAPTRAGADTLGVTLAAGTWIDLRVEASRDTSAALTLDGPEGQLVRLSTNRYQRNSDVLVPQTGRYVVRGVGAPGAYRLRILTRGVGETRELRGTLAPGDTARHVVAWYDPADPASDVYAIRQAAFEGLAEGALVLDLDRFGEPFRAAGDARAVIQPVVVPAEAEMKDGPVVLLVSRPAGAHGDLDYVVRVWSWDYDEAEMPPPPPPAPPGGRF